MRSPLGTASSVVGTLRYRALGLHSYDEARAQFRVERQVHSAALSFAEYLGAVSLLAVGVGILGAEFGWAFAIRSEIFRDQFSALTFGADSYWAAGFVTLLAVFQLGGMGLARFGVYQPNHKLRVYALYLSVALHIVITLSMVRTTSAFSIIWVGVILWAPLLAVRTVTVKNGWRNGDQ